MTKTKTKPKTKPKTKKATAVPAERPLATRTKVSTRMSVTAQVRAAKAAVQLGLTLNSFVGIAAVLLTERIERFLAEDPQAVSKMGAAELFGLAGVREPR